MNPLIPIPSVLDRAIGLVTYQFRNDPTILGYRIRVANSLTNAYGTANGVVGAGTTALFDVNRGATFISRALRNRRLPLPQDSVRGQTRGSFDPNEYVGLSAVVPPDNQIAFVRVQVRTAASPTFPVLVDNTTQSEILVVQDATFFTTPSPNLSLSGVAPNLAAAAIGLPAPPGALVFHLPAYGSHMILTNLAAAGGTPILYSLGRGQPLVQINPQVTIFPARVEDELVVCANGGNPAFSVLFSIVTGVD